MLDIKTNLGAKQVKTLFLARCCRVWTLALGWNIGKCGLCGEIPTPISGTARRVEKDA
jgi:hypothetical protein